MSPLKCYITAVEILLSQGSQTKIQNFLSNWCMYTDTHSKGTNERQKQKVLL